MDTRRTRSKNQQLSQHRCEVSELSLPTNWGPADPRVVARMTKAAGDMLIDTRHAQAKTNNFCNTGAKFQNCLSLQTGALLIPG